MTEEETSGPPAPGAENPDVDAQPVPEGSGKAISSYEIFERCVVRAENLISLHDSTEDIDAVSDAHYCDCYRAAIVLTISALDAFLRKAIVAEIRKLLADPSKPVNEELAAYVKGLLNQDKLLDAARKYDLLDQVENAVKSDFETKSFQGEWKIETYLKLVGYKNIFSEVSIKADVNEENLRRKLNIFTNRRHVIAHSGDFDLNQTPHKENDIQKGDARECIDTVRLFAKTIHDVMEGSK